MLEKINNKVIEGSRCCSSRNCNGEGVFFLKLSIAKIAGYFCSRCASELKEYGILEEVVQE